MFSGQEPKAKVRQDVNSTALAFFFFFYPPAFSLHDTEEEVGRKKNELSVILIWSAHGEKTWKKQRQELSPHAVGTMAKHANVTSCKPLAWLQSPTKPRCRRHQRHRACLLSCAPGMPVIYSP